MGAPSLEQAVIKDRGGKEVQAKSLWENKPVVVVVLRRPGCLLCREESLAVWGAREQFEALGFALACVVHEWKEREVAAFAPEYWGGPIYWDEQKAFYAAVHGGSVKKGSLLDLLNPFGQAWKNMKRAKARGAVKDSNLTGDGMTLGGLLVLDTKGAVRYAYPEKTFGDHAPVAEVLEACKKVTAA